MSLAALCLIISAARPRIAQGMVQTKIIGVDVALAIDLSGSMRAEDLKPSRIEAAKATLKEFVMNFNQGRSRWWHSPGARSHSARLRPTARY